MEGILEDKQGSQDTVTKLEARPDKKKREGSPEPGQIRWRLKPTLLDLGRKKTPMKEEESNQQKKEGNMKKTGGDSETETKPEPEKEVEKSMEEAQPQMRTPVRERIRRLNKKAGASPGKFPLI